MTLDAENEEDNHIWVCVLDRNVCAWCGIDQPAGPDTPEGGTTND